MAIYKKLRKFVSKARKGVRSAAKSYLKYKRTPVGKMLSKRVKNYGFSSTAVAKSLSNIHRKMAVSAEYGTVDNVHTTGSPDVALRQYYLLQASAQLAVVGTTSSPPTTGQIGYLQLQVNDPTVGTGVSNYNGQKYSIESIQWKGTLNLANNTNGCDGYVRLYIVEYRDQADSNFNIAEFLNTDMNGEYSTSSRRNRDHFYDYKVIASKTFALTYGNKTRQDFNMMARPKRMVRHHDTGAATKPVRYMCVAVVSKDIAEKQTQVVYAGGTRMRFIA